MTDSTLWNGGSSYSSSPNYAVTTKGAKRGGFSIQVRRILKGHFGKIYSAHWSTSSENNRLVSASQDGKLVVWNGSSTNKLSAIGLKSSWVMACAYGPQDASGNALVAAGGLDNTVTVYSLDPEAKSSDTPKCELAAHEGYVSCLRFLPEGTNKVMSASGDGKVVLWDLKKNSSTIFSDHKADVMSIAICPTQSNLVLSGSCDHKAKLRDVRQDKKSTVLTWGRHDSDVNSVAWMRNGLAFASGSDDSSCLVRDIRWEKADLAVLADTKSPSGVTSLDFSATGRICFTAYDDNCIPTAWDVLSSKPLLKLGEDKSNGFQHEERVSCIQVSPSGQAVLTASWDMFLKIWA